MVRISEEYWRGLFRRMGEYRIVTRSRYARIAAQRIRFREEFRKRRLLPDVR